METGSRGRYAKFCVQVDLEQPLTKQVVIGKHYQQVLYEGLSSLCFSCGRIGHKKETCQYRIRETVNLDYDQTLEDDKPKIAQMEEVDEYGPWIVVTRRKATNKLAEKLVQNDQFNLGPSQYLVGTNSLVGPSMEKSLTLVKIQLMSLLKGNVKQDKEI